MNYKMIFNTLGKTMIALSIMLLLPAIVSVIYLESCLWSFLISAGIVFVVGITLFLTFKPKNHLIYAKEGFAIVSLVWIMFSLFGCLPFVISGEIPSFFDAFFETASGFTTTGASIVENVEALSHGILFWRSFTHWIGGMGVLVFVLAIIPNISDRSIHLLKAEVPGPTFGKIVPKLKESSKILYIIYFAITVTEMIFLIAGGMPVFDGIVTSLGTAGTGGFGIKADSIGGYSAYCQWVVAIFMLLFGINFNLYYMILIRKIRDVFKSEELWTYISIVAVATALIAINISNLYDNFGDVLRHSLFQVSSLITTTGYGTQDFNLWPTMSKTILFMLMFIGGCAGSTAGGFKISRIVVLFKNILREIRRLLHPRSVSTVKIEGKQMDERTVSSVGVYLAIYVICLAITFLLLSFEPFSIETNLSAAVSCFNNIGPGLDAVGPASSYACYSDFSKIVLSFTMLFGRLEIFPMLLLFSPRLWKKD